MKAMLLAAGKATRFRPVTECRPKGAIPLLNIPLLYYPLHFLQQEKISDLVVNLHYHGDQIKSLMGAIRDSDVRVYFSDESQLLLGSGGGIKKAETLLKGEGSFLVSNGDEVIFPQETDVLKQMISFHKREKNFATLMVTDHPGVGTQFGGVWVDAENRVIDFGLKAPPQAKKGFHFVGVQIIADEVFSLIPENQELNIFYDVFKNLLKEKIIKVFPMNCLWYETGNINDFLAASAALTQDFESLVKNKFGRSLMQRFWESEVAAPSKISSSLKTKSTLPEHLIVGSRCIFGENIKFIGTNVIGSDVHIGSSAQLENCVVGSDVTIAADSVHQNEIILSSVSL